MDRSSKGAGAEVLRGEVTRISDIVYFFLYFAHTYRMLQ